MSKQAPPILRQLCQLCKPTHPAATPTRKKPQGGHRGRFHSPSPCACCHAQLFATLWAAASQAPLSMGFSRQESWNRLPFPSPGYLPNPRIKPRSPALQADSLPAEPQGSPRVLDWVAYLFSSRSSWPRNRTRVSCIAGRFFTNWTIREDWKKNS